MTTPDETQRAPHATVDMSVYDWHRLLRCLEELMSIRNSLNRAMAVGLYEQIASTLAGGQVRVADGSE